jgi:Protein of unknown function (DUF3277)
MKAYGFSNIVLLINGVEISGFSDGDDAISMKRLSDLASHKIGSDGRMMVSLSSDRSGEITIKLQQTSGSNKYLNALANSQQALDTRFIPVLVYMSDTYRGDTASGVPGYLKKLPDLVRGEKGQNQDWVIVVENLQIFLSDTPSLESLLG